jgi:hypothetical protein
LGEPFFGAVLNAENDRFAKTGSGQMRGRGAAKRRFFLQGVEYRAVISQAEAELVRRKQKQQQQQQRCFSPTVFWWLQKCITLPRQARDKHVESTQKRDAFSRRRRRRRRLTIQTGQRAPGMAATFSGAVFAHGVASHLPALKSVAASQSQPVSRKSVAASQSQVSRSKEGNHTACVCVVCAVFWCCVFKSPVMKTSDRI